MRRRRGPSGRRGGCDGWLDAAAAVLARGGYGRREGVARGRAGGEDGVGRLGAVELLDLVLAELDASTSLLLPSDREVGCDGLRSSERLDQLVDGEQSPTEGTHRLVVVVVVWLRLLAVPSPALHRLVVVVGSRRLAVCAGRGVSESREDKRPRWRGRDVQRGAAGGGASR